ncbi:LytTR family DNA-binding domain-containing protein [Companilactobacillus ginsenosidimutans]|uniref:LytTR family DNA-binding domain-containing protein n=1 Tax=Companilactobacillus ginsenosidimutans TaxID=1007676 RepID=UPI000AC10952|nr:LytTR family DNA-binding domain-containing protein [Companilactobacillus ginsenosidimutans]
MKIRIDISPQYSEKEIVIRSSEKDDEFNDILNKIKDIESQLGTINGYSEGSVYSIALSDVLFFETNDRNIYAHTTDNSYLVHHRLYELEDNLPNNFLRISKSSILNVDEILSLSTSVTGNLVQFRDSYKSVYVSRRFLKELKNRLNQRKL